jgi:hypothetical protein
VLGLINTPDPCQELRAEVTRAGRLIRLTVIARSLPVLCIQVIGSFAYTAVIDNLAPAVYTLEVFHAYENTGWPRTRVLAEPVAVE